MVISDTYCSDENDKRMVLNDTVLCRECGCEVWFEDAHDAWERNEIGFGWISRFGKTYFKTSAFAQHSYLPERSKANYSICSFCLFQKKINNDGGLRVKRDRERAEILRWLGIDHMHNQMNRENVRELVNLKRIEIQTKRELKKIKA